jgi:hypothetical protein
MAITLTVMDTVAFAAVAFAAVAFAAVGDPYNQPVPKAALNIPTL